LAHFTHEIKNKNFPDWKSTGFFYQTSVALKKIDKFFCVCVYAKYKKKLLKRVSQAEGTHTHKGNRKPNKYTK
jgi:hypothetical protein